VNHAGRSRGALLGVAFSLAAGLLTLAPWASFAATTSGRNALGQVVASCLAVKRTLGTPFPCLEVSSDGETQHVVLRVPGAATHVLVVPTEAITGLEDRALRRPSTSTLWNAAWEARKYIEEALNRPLARGAIGLAVNSQQSRSQDRLHIHVDCVRKDVQSRLEGLRPREADRTWTLLPGQLGGSRYWIKAMRADSLRDLNPVEMIPKLPRWSSRQMETTSLALIGMTFRDGRNGFYVLASYTSGSAESLLDHRCSGVS
jgi:CDP-diacylglycerol pyrophosphatase